MAFLPVKPAQSAVVTAEASELPQIVTELPAIAPFFSFSYSSRHLQVIDGQTQVTSKQVRFDGKQIEVEEFDGRLPANVYDQAVLDTQRFFADQTTAMLKQFSAFLPFPMNRLGDKE